MGQARVSKTQTANPELSWWIPGPARATIRGARNTRGSPPRVPRCQRRSGGIPFRRGVTCACRHAGWTREKENPRSAPAGNTAARLKDAAVAPPSSHVSGRGLRQGTGPHHLQWRRRRIPGFSLAGRARVSFELDRDTGPRRREPLPIATTRKPEKGSSCGTLAPEL